MTLTNQSSCYGHGRKKASDASFESMVGMSSWVDSLFIWFPLPHGCLLLRRLSVRKPCGILGGLVSGALLPLLTRTCPKIPKNREFSFTLKRWHVDKSGSCPILQSRVNVDWLTFAPNIFTPLFRRIFNQKASMTSSTKPSIAWHNAPHSRIMVSLLLPGTMEAEDWLYLARDNRHMWPLQMISHSAAAKISTEKFMRKERRRLQARHIWMEVEPQWSKIKERIYTKHATGLPWMTLYNRLFLNEFTGESRWLEDP